MMFRVNSLSSHEKWNMKVSTIEGCLMASALQVFGSFLAVYIIGLGGSEGQVGIATSVPFLVATAALLFGARVRASGPADALRLSLRAAIVHRIVIALVPLAPLFAARAPIWVIVIYSLSAGVMTLSATHWTALVSDMFPPGKRGRIFGIRGVWVGLISFLAVFGAGHLLDAFPFPHNFTITYGIAIAMGAGATVFLARLRPPSEDDSPGLSATASEVPQARAHTAQRTGPFTGQLRKDFLQVTVPVVLFNIGFHGLAPVVNIYFIERLGFSNATIGTLASTFVLTQVVGSLVWGHLIDRWGNRAVAFVALAGIASQAFLFWLVPSVGYLLAMQAFGGFCLPGVTLGTFNMVIAAGDRRTRSQVIRWVNVFANLAAFLGPLLGTGLLLYVGLVPAFLVMGGFRAVASWVLLSAAIEDFRAEWTVQRRQVGLRRWRRWRRRVGLRLRSASRRRRLSG